MPDHVFKARHNLDAAHPLAMPFHLIRSEFATAWRFVAVLDLRHVCLPCDAYEQVRAAFAYFVQACDAAPQFAVHSHDVRLIVVGAANHYLPYQ